MSQPLIKVCGNKYSDNLIEVCTVKVDYLGFIFHSESPRGVSVKECRELVREVPDTIKTVGVFVSAQLDMIRKIHEEISFSAIQLHGKEDLSFVRALRSSVDAEIIKAFSVDSGFDFSDCTSFEEWVDFFLFDTKGVRAGGNGMPFDWNLLFNYRGNIPFFIAGGISSPHGTVLKKLYSELPQLRGFDINSGFETAPGRKDVSKVAAFIGEVR